MFKETRSPLEQLQARTQQGLTTTKRVELAIAIGTMPESARLAEILGHPLPTSRDTIRGLGKFLFDTNLFLGSESYARFALVCAEALMPSIPPALRVKCADLLVRAYARIAAPRHASFDLDQLRATNGLREDWSDWLSNVSMSLEHKQRSKESMAYMGFGLTMTCVSEWLSHRPGFRITDPSQLAGYADGGDHQIFWEVLRRDFIPWLIGGSLP